MRRQTTTNGHANGHTKGQANGQAKGHTTVHTASNRLEEMLKGLTPRERIERLAEIARGLKTSEQVQAEIDAKPAKPAKQVPSSAAPPPPSATVPDGEKPTEGRDPQSGRFAAGNKCGRGNPHARRQAELRNIMTEAVGPERLRAIAVRLAGKALLGDCQAAQLLFAYILGKPRLAPDPDRLDLEEWKLLDASPSVAEVARAMIDAIDPGAASEYVRERIPAAPEKVREAIGEAKGLGVEILSLCDKRSGRKRKPSAPLPG